MFYYLLNLIIIILIVFGVPAKVKAENIKEQLILNVPFTSEVPNGKWVKPWNNACEEASIIMVEEYYVGNTKLNKKEAIKKIQPLFSIENKIFGSNADTDAIHTVRLINNHTDFNATVITNPTLEEIKNELRAQRPVITFHYAKNIANPNYRFRRNGSYYHVIVLVGFDDAKQEFIANDSGDEKTGGFHRYSYQMIMSTLHDFVWKTKTATGLPTVAFTSSKVLMKTKSSPAVYLVAHSTKQPIADANTFIKHGWQWQNIRLVNEKTLNQLETQPLLID